MKNPLAREIVDACQGLGLDVVFEPGKMHPKDWANPGRVRVGLKSSRRVKNSELLLSFLPYDFAFGPFCVGHLRFVGRDLDAGEHRKGKRKNNEDETGPRHRTKTSFANNLWCPEHHLYNLISDHLLAHPTTASSPMRLRIAGMPPPKEPLPAPAVPRGWKMGDILPLHSPALSGGGVSENILRDMMAEMQGQSGGAIDGVAGGGGGVGGGGGGKKKKDKGKK